MIIHKQINRMVHIWRYMLLLLFLGYIGNIYGQTTIANSCPNTTVNLTSAYSASNLPSGTSISWHTAQPADGTNLVGDATMVGAGTYYAAFYDATNMCYSDNSTEVSVTINSCAPITNVCPATTVDLTTAYSASNLPSGTSISWHTAQPADGTNLVGDATMVGAGTYYAAFYDATNMCYSDNSTEVSVTINSCAPITNVCPATTVDLTTAYSASNLPSGTSISWHTAQPADGTNLVGDATMVGAGTYYAAFYDATNMCYSDNSTEISVQINSCAPITNTCPATTVDLTTAYSASNLPSGTSISWHTAQPADGTNLVGDATMVGAGTYYAAFYDATNMCYSDNSTEISVQINSCTIPEITNTCPATSLSFADATAQSDNVPAGMTVTLHTAQPADGNNLATEPITASGTYYAAFYDETNNCYSDNSSQVTVTINTCTPIALSNTCPSPSLSFADATTLSDNVPAGSTVTLHTAQPADASNLASDPITTSGTYYAAFYHATDDCYSVTSSEVAVTINACAIPEITNTCPATSLSFADATTQSDNVPAGMTVTLHTAQPADGNNLATEPITASGTYYAAFYDETNNCYSDNSSQVTVTINTCTPIALSNTCPSPSLSFADATTLSDNVPAGSTVTLHTAQPADASNLANDPITTSGTYYAAFYDATNDCYSVTSSEVAVTINACATPEITNTCPATSLSFADATAQSVNVPTGSTVTLHTAQPADGSNLATEPITASGTYYAAFYDETNNCYSDNSSQVTVTINTCTPIALSNTCPATSLSFADATTLSDNVPAGSTVTLHTAQPADASNLASDPITTSGTYYAAFYHATDDCYSVTSSEVAVTINVCNTDTDDDGNPDTSDPNPSTPTAANDTGSGDPLVATTVDILANDDYLTNNDGNNAGTTAITDTGNGNAAGTISFDASTGELTYTPTAGEAGMTVTIEYQVCNADPDPDVCATATVSFTVNDPCSGNDATTICAMCNTTDGTNQSSPLCALDCDGDGVDNATECDNGTDPNSSDSDGDGDPDNTDPAPNDPCSWGSSQVLANATMAWNDADCDGDGVTNQDEVDSDNNGTAGPNATDPNDACSLTLADVSVTATSTGDCDGDGVTDADEINSTDPSTDPQTDPTAPCAFNAAEQGTASAAWAAADCDMDGNENGTDPNPLTATANDDTGTAPFGTTTTIDLLANDDYLANDNNNIVQIGGTASGTINFDPAAGTLDYTPDASEPGTDVTVVYRVCQAAICADATVTITVPAAGDMDGDGDPDNTDPAPNDACVWSANQVLADALASWNDADCDGDGVTNQDEVDPDNDGTAGPNATDPNDACSLTLADVSVTATSTGDCDGDGVPDADEINSTGGGDPQTDPTDACSFNTAEQTGTPDAAWTTADCDMDGNPNPTDPNPLTATANDDTGTAPFGANTAIDILANDDFDANDGNTITDAGTGTVAGTISFDPVAGTLTYMPTAGEVGTDVTLVYEVCQGAVCDQATVTITVPAAGDMDGDGDPDNTDPAPNDACVWSANQVLADALASWNDADCDGDGVTNQDEVDPDNDGTAGPNATDPNDACSLTLADVSVTATSTGDCDGDGVPDADEINSTGGGDPQTDPTDACSFNTAEQTGTPDAAWTTADCDMDGNPNPTDPNPLTATANDDTGTAPFGANTAIDILANDDFDANDGNTITDAGTGTAAGTISFDPVAGTLTYMPTAGEVGTDVTLVYEVCQGAVCDQATVTITVPAAGDMDGDGDPDNTDPAPNDACVWSANQVLADALASWNDADCDGDGVTNQDEVDPDNDGTAGPNATDPNDACSLTLADVSVTATSTGDCDGDGVPDADEINSTGGGDPQTDPTDACSFNTAEQTGTPDAAWTTADCDMDGNPNPTDPNPLTATANDDTGTAPFGANTAIDILANDDFDANDGNTITDAGTGTAAGTISFDPVAGTLTYMPTAGEVGTDVTLVYEVCQGAVCDQATVNEEIWMAMVPR